MRGRGLDSIDEELGLGFPVTPSQLHEAPGSFVGPWLSRLWEYPQSLIWGYTASPSRSADPPDVLLSRALREDNPELIQEAIRRDANQIVAVDGDKRTALHRAACCGKSACVQVLLQLGADKDAQDAQGRTPLHLAAWTGRVGALTVLILAGANKNALDVKKNTPAHLGAFWGQIECIKMLFEWGANMTLVNSQNQTPLQVAQNMCPNTEIVRYLRVALQSDSGLAGICITK